MRLAADWPAGLSDGVALVTGGAQGIGAAVVERLASLGVRVAFLDLDDDASERVVGLCAARDQHVIACSGDVSKRADVRRAVELCQAEFGRLNMLVAAAGTAGSGAAQDVDDASWRRVLAVNLDGMFYAIQEAGRAMMDGGGGGSIVAVGSTNAFWVESNMAAYNASKGGVVALAKSAALDLAVHGIRVNVVAPGIVRTRLSRFLTDDPVQANAYLKGVPLKRFASVEDVASAAVYLLSDEASYVTGHTLVLDGGSTAGVNLSVPDAAFADPT